MRVLHVVPSYYPASVYGGPIYSTHALCQNLARRGLDVRVLTTNANGRHDTLDVDDSSLIELEPRLGVRYCRRIAAHDVSTRLLECLRAWTRWADLVHLTAVYSFPTLPTLTACRWTEKPLVWSPRGSLQTWARSSHRRAKALWEIACRALLPRNSVMHVTSAREAESSGAVFPQTPIVVIPNGVYAPAATPLPALENGFRLLYLGRLDPIKGLEGLLDACIQLNGRRPFEWSLTVAGTGDPAYAASIAARIRQVGLDGRVTLVGEAGGARKHELLVTSHVVVIPSHSESFGMVVAEALAHGRPVIASRGTPWSDVESIGCGLWVDNTPEALAAAIVRIRSMPMAEMGNRGRLWMRTEFAWSNVAARMEAVYRGLLEPAA